MKFEKINNNKKMLLIPVIVFVVVLSLSVGTSLAKYKITKSIKLASGTINYSPADFSLMGIYIESDDGYTSVDEVPTEGYEFNSETSYCEKSGVKQDVTINYDIESNALSITPMETKGLKCYLYFDVIKNHTVESIIASKTITTRSDFSTVLTTDTTGTLYSAADNDGSSYYYAGNPTDNWVKFAGFYWRIIRFNGDGSIRLIYNGTSTTTTGTGTQINTSSYNTDSNNNMYAGYMYTSGSVHGLGTSSTIKGILDTWYDSNLLNYTSYIDPNAGFCGDRTPYTNNSGTTSGGGTGTTITYYGAHKRLVTNKSPSLECNNSTDLYTTSSSSKGNRALAYPIGLITADEIAYAGGTFEAYATNNYLNTNQFYWTISPFSYVNSGVLIFSMGEEGWLIYDSATTSIGVRPVINLKSGTIFTPESTGTSTNPYEIAS